MTIFHDVLTHQLDTMAKCCSHDLHWFEKLSQRTDRRTLWFSFKLVKIKLRNSSHRTRSFHKSFVTLQLFSEGRQQYGIQDFRQGHSDTKFSSYRSKETKQLVTTCATLEKRKWRLVFRYIPVLVEAATALLGQMLGPDIDQSTQAEWSLNVADSANSNHWRCLQNGDSLDDLLLVDLYITRNLKMEVKHVRVNKKIFIF